MQAFRLPSVPWRHPEATIRSFASGTAFVLTLLGFTLLLGVPSRSAAQGADAATPSSEESRAWEPIWLLEGTWEARITGALGEGTGLRQYERIFGGPYVVSRHASVRLPQPESPAGDHHRELAVYSYDRERGTMVLREFMVEGYVVQSTCETAPRRFVCTSEEVESGPGIRARLTVEITDPYQFTETYELAFPGDELAVLLTNSWTRVPNLD